MKEVECFYVERATTKVKRLMIIRGTSYKMSQSSNTLPQVGRMQRM
jgi:hypothetical protein